jgi:hypothetical protein
MASTRGNDGSAPLRLLGEDVERSHARHSPAPHK